MCLASIDMTALEQMNESVIDVCDACGGSGKIEWAYHANSPEPDGVRTCGHCNGEGFVLVAAEPADEERMEEA